MKNFLLPFFFLFALSLTITAQQQQQEKTDAAVVTPAPQPQQKQTFVPVSYGLVVDNSGSYRMILDRVIEAAKDIVEENKADDETFLARFVSSDKIKILQDFTVSKDEIHMAADEMYAEGGLTAILDAVDFSARYLVEKSSRGDGARRKILVLITDGDDRQSAAKIESVLKYLKDNQIRVFALGLSDEKVSLKLLDRLTKETGGKKFVPKMPKEVPTLIKELTTAMRAAP